MNLWIRVVANIGSRKVVWRLVTSRGLSVEAAVGHLVMLWGAVAENTKGGYVGDVPDAQLEAWAHWRGEPGAFASFIRESHVTHGYINEWDEYSGAWEERREKDRARKAAQRVRRKSRGSHADAPQDVTGLHNTTEHNREVQQQLHTAPDVAVIDQPLPSIPPDQPPAPARPARPATPARSGARRHPNFPDADRVRLHRHWVEKIGPLDMGRFVKAWSAVYGTGGPLYPLEQQLAAIEAFRDGVDATPVAFRVRWNVEKCVAELGSTWIRLGGQMATDGDGLTERGRLIYGDGRKVPA